MYYYGARYYDPRLSIFISVDPLAEKTMTPYQYVSNNPIMRIDPTGMNDHDYKLNKDGSLEKTRHTKDNYDRIFNEKGDDGIVVSKGFIDMSHEVKDDKGNKSTVYPMSSDDVKYGSGKSIFKFFADNTHKEYGYSEFKNNKTGNKFGFLITSGLDTRIYNVGKTIGDYLSVDQNVFLTYNTHNHPTKYDPEWYHSGTTPSGFIKTSKLNTTLIPGVN